MVTIPVNNDLLLRTYSEEDAGALFVAVNNNRTHLNPWLMWVSQTTRPDHSLQFIQQSKQKTHNQEALDLGIFHNDTIIGGVGMHNWRHDVKKAEIGYWLTKDYEGKGIISSCLSHFVPFLFDKLGLNKIEVHFVAANKRSARVAEQLGCRIEGVLRQSAVRNGMAEDLVIAGLLRSEWKQR